MDQVSVGVSDQEMPPCGRNQGGGGATGARRNMYGWWRLDYELGPSGEPHGIRVTAVWDIELQGLRINLRNIPDLQ